MITEPMAPQAARRFDVFLSYNSVDRPAVVRIARHLKEAELEPWLDRWSLTPGRPWQDEIAEGLRDSAAFAVFVGEGGVEDWARLELSAAWSRAVKDEQFRLIPVLLPGARDFDSSDLPPFLCTRTWVDLRDGSASESGLQDLRNAILGLPFGPDVVAPAPDGPCPYVGLAAFEEADAEFFFGRTNHVQRLLARMGSRRLVAVIGPSGSGKSSLVRAGMLPRIRSGALPGSDEWLVRVLRPGAFPVRALATAVLDLAPTPAMQLELDRLCVAESSLHEATERVLLDSSPQRRVLLVVDQAEELFTLCRVEPERRAFLSAVHHATAVPGGRTTVVLTMRGDFYPKLAGFPAFAEFVGSQQMLVGGLERTEIREVIEGPARVAGLRVEPALVDTVVADVVRAPGSLPLLQHALLETWRRRRGATLTLEGYRASGGLERGLAERADALYDELPSAGQAFARDLLLRLVQPGEGTEDTRRRMRLREVKADETGEDVVRRFVAERLLMTSGDDANAWVEISHEVLLRNWPLLRGWIDADRQGLRIHRALTVAVQDWERLGKDAGTLYRGGRLVEAREWVERDPDRLNEAERDFLAASDAAEQTARTRRRRITRWTITALAAALAVISTVAVAAVVNGREAARQRDLAISRQLAANAVDVLAADPSLSLALAMRAYDTAPTAQAEEILRRATAASHNTAVLSAGTGGVYSAQLFDDGRAAASAGADGVVRIWDVPEQRVTATIPGHVGIVTSVRVSPDGRRVASAGADGTVALVDLADKRPQVVVRVDGGYATSAVFSPDGKLLAAGLSDGSVRLVDTDTGRETAALALGSEPVFRVAFRPDGRAVVAAGGDGTAQVWDVATQMPIAVLRGHVGPVLAAVFDPTGAQVVTAGDDGTVRIWDAVSGAPVRTIPVDDQTLFALAVSPDGRRFATASEDGIVRIRSMDGVTLADLSGHAGEVLDLGFDAGGRLVSAGRDGTVRVWVAAADDAVALPATWADEGPDGSRVVVGETDGHAWVLTARGLTQQLDLVGPAGRNWPRFSPDGARIVSAYEDGSVEVWDARDGHRIADLHPQHGPVWSARLDVTGSTVVIGTDDGSIVLDRLSGGPATTLPAAPGPINAVLFGPDGAVVSAGGEGTIRIWSPTRAPLLLHGHDGEVRGLAVTADSALLASAGADGTVRLWRTADGTPVATLRGHQGPANAVAFAADGTLFSTGDDGSVRVWDVRSARLLVTLPVSPTPGTSVAVEPDGRTVLTVSAEGRVVRQTVCEVCGPITAVQELARSRGARPLSPEEELRYLS